MTSKSPNPPPKRASPYGPTVVSPPPPMSVQLAVNSDFKSFKDDTSAQKGKSMISELFSKYTFHQRLDHEGAIIIFRRGTSDMADNEEIDTLLVELNRPMRGVDPKLSDVLDDLRFIWRRWQKEEASLRSMNAQSKASTQRLCMEDIERLAEKYGVNITGSK